MTILILAGSSRKESLNKKLQKRLAQRAEELGLNCHLYPAEDLDAPIYNGDDEVEKGVPASIQKLATAIRDANKIIVVSPEYNGGPPPLLKNAVDWTSRLEQVPWENKTVLLAGASPGRLGAMRSMNHLRISLGDLKAWVAPFFGSVPHASDETIAELDNDFLDEFLRQGD